MKGNSIVSKLLLIVTIIMAVSFIVIASILSFWFEDYYSKQRKEQLQQQSNIVGAAAVSYANISGDSNNLELQSVLDFVSKSVEADILLVDSLGYVYENSSSIHNNLKFTKLDLTDDKWTELKSGNAIELKGGESNGFDESQVISYQPLREDGVFRGVVVIVTPLDKIREPLRKVYKIIWMSAVLALSISTIGISYISQKMLIKPIEEINNAAKKLAKGQVENRVHIHSNDEIGELAESFNFMADSLEKVDKNRREFISNVSHELRSPITSIKGFISGILDGVIPKERENDYLKLAYDEIQRLTRLINDLLDLSAMESGRMKLNIREIDINEMIRLTVLNMESKIKDKNIEVDLRLEDRQLYVLGDEDRIRQVLTNLIDNAIKYGKNEGGLIRVSTDKRGGKVITSVYNNGPIIPKNEINSIWERFYKSDKSRTNKVSTGLGLPIVRHILTQHEEDIWVENKGEIEGVEFSFTLKKSK